LGAVFAKNTSLETKYPSPIGSENFSSLDWYFSQISLPKAREGRKVKQVFANTTAQREKKFNPHANTPAAIKMKIHENTPAINQSKSRILI
jgi:hypothetical protein